VKHSSPYTTSLVPSASKSNTLDPVTFDEKSCEARDQAMYPCAGQAPLAAKSQGPAEHTPPGLGLGPQSMS